MRSVVVAQLHDLVTNPVYKLAAKRQWVGEIEAVDEREAIEISAKEFKQPATKLMAIAEGSKSPAIRPLDCVPCLFLSWINGQG